MIGALKSMHAKERSDVFRGDIEQAIAVLSNIDEHTIFPCLVSIPEDGIDGFWLDKTPNVTYVDVKLVDRAMNGLTFEDRFYARLMLLVTLSHELTHALQKDNTRRPFLGVFESEVEHSLRVERDLLNNIWKEVSPRLIEMDIMEQYFTNACDSVVNSPNFPADKKDRLIQAMRSAYERSLQDNNQQPEYQLIEWLKLFNRTKRQPIDLVGIAYRALFTRNTVGSVSAIFHGIKVNWGDRSYADRITTQIGRLLDSPQLSHTNYDQKIKECITLCENLYRLITRGAQ